MRSASGHDSSCTRRFPPCCTAEQHHRRQVARRAAAASSAVNCLPACTIAMRDLLLQQIEALAEDRPVGKRPRTSTDSPAGLPGCCCLRGAYPTQTARCRTGCAPELLNGRCRGRKPGRGRDRQGAPSCPRRKVLRRKSRQVQDVAHLIEAAAILADRADLVLQRAPRPAPARPPRWYFEHRSRPSTHRHPPCSTPCRRCWSRRRRPAINQVRSSAITARLLPARAAGAADPQMCRACWTGLDRAPRRARARPPLMAISSKLIRCTRNVPLIGGCVMLTVISRPTRTVGSRVTKRSVRRGSLRSASSACA